MIKIQHHLPPLAERIRPKNLEEFIGQSSLLKSNSLLMNAVENQRPFSMIFWGPPGTGKTTLARILAKQFKTEYFQLSAVSSGVAKVREVLQKGKENQAEDKQTILFIDEIHRFTKSQQDSLLHAVEDGSIILMGATTENPSFEVISPLLSRCKILKLTSFSKDELSQLLDRAFKTDIVLSNQPIDIETKAKLLLIDSSGGDGRKMLNTLELAMSFINDTQLVITKPMILEALQEKNVIYDKSGDYHYDTVSAFIKSIRGSDPDASIYWLAVMIEGGEKPEFIARRLIILASEDIGNADPYALMLATSAMQSVHFVGFPESAIILGQVTTYLASAPKSNASYMAIKSAQNLVRQEGTKSVPLHLRNAPTQLMKSEGYGKEYKYPHNYPNHFVEDNYFPDEFSPIPSFYKPTQLGRERFLRERLSELWGNRFN